MDVKVLLGRIIGMVAPITPHLLLEGLTRWSGFTGLYGDLALCHNPVLRNHRLSTVHLETSDIILPRIHFAEKIPHSTRIKLLAIPISLIDVDPRTVNDLSANNDQLRRHRACANDNRASLLPTKIIENGTSKNVFQL
jgi:hypothetical protein